MATTKPQKAKPAASAPQPKPKATVIPVSFLFARENYTIMAVGVAVIILGFVLMTGVANDSPTGFNGDEIYSFRRITLAPITVLIGFLIEVYAILKRPKEA